MDKQVIVAAIPVEAAKDHKKYNLPAYPPIGREHEYTTDNCSRCNREVYIGPRIKEVLDNVKDSVLLCAICIAQDEELRKKELVPLSNK